jgi:hypothetical protein
VDLEATCPITIITQGETEFSKSGSVHILASHPSERLRWILMEVYDAKELMNRHWLNRLLKSDKVKNIHLDKSIMYIVEVFIDILLEVIGVKDFGIHNVPTFHGLFSTIVVIPHDSLRFSPELLVTTSVLSHMEAVQVLLPDATPTIDMHRSQISVISFSLSTSVVPRLTPFPFLDGLTPREAAI